MVQRDRQMHGVAPHLPCGLVQPEMLRKLADVAEKYGVRTLKITGAARVALVGVEEKDVEAIRSELDTGPGLGAELGACSVKACSGTTYCQRGLQDSLSLGLKFDDKYQGMKAPGKFTIGISGCPRQCAETCIKDIGLVGTAKGWCILVGGNGGARPRLAQELTRDLTGEEAVRLVDKIIAYYQANAKPRQRLGALIEKIGLDAFRQAILGPDAASVENE